VADGTVLYWTTNQTSGSINSFDFTGGVTGGSLLINGNTATLVRQIATDTDVGIDAFIIQLRLNGTTGTIVASSPQITITAPTYNMTTGSSVVCEGDVITFNITTTNVIDGTVLYWEVVPNTSTGNTTLDFDTPNGTAIINSNAGSFNLLVTVDALNNETNETLTV
jgi:hypothetical protein